MHIWRYSHLVSERLMKWNVANIAIGFVLLFRGRFWRGVGSQSVGWGIINIAIAVGGDYFTRRRVVKLDDPFEPNLMRNEADKLRRILWINAGLDVFYMLGGWSLAQTRGRKNSFWRGGGLGIILQGGLLFVFDVIHALNMPQQRDVSE